MEWALHHRCLTIDIDDQTGKMVALPMHQTVGVVLRIVGNTDGKAHLQCRLQTGIPERTVDLHIGEGQDTDGNRALLVMTHSDEIALIRDDTH